MKTEAFIDLRETDPLCPVFNQCGGCDFQHLHYSTELSIKQNQICSLFKNAFNLEESLLEPIIASPKEYHYRHRLNLALRRKKDKSVVVGFTSKPPFQTISVDSCAIVDESISNALPQLKEEVLASLPSHYRTANLVIKIGDNEKIVWGGIGKNSLKLDPENYLFTFLNDKKIFYSLDTFFQANLSIIPLVVQKMIEWISFDASKTIFLDLYGGVGLFSLLLADRIKQGVILEENPASIALAKFNIDYHRFSHLNVFSGTVEACVDELLKSFDLKNVVAMVDPPRGGLQSTVCEALIENETLTQLLYLSCNPYSLIVDLKKLIENGWKIQKVVPFDFFPKTKHIEVLTFLTRG